MFFWQRIESVTWTDEFNQTITETGFEHVPGGQQYSRTSVFSFHYYEPPNEGRREEYFWERTHDAINKWNTTSFLTEFGISNDGQNPTTNRKQNEVLDTIDSFGLSWIGWEYKPFAGATPDGTCTGCGRSIFEKDGEKNEMVAKLLSRTYPQFIAGRLNSWHFGWETSKFTLEYEIDASLQAPTVIYLSKSYWYDDILGYKIDITPGGLLDSKETNKGLNIELTPKGDDANGKTVTVVISKEIP